MTEWNDSSVDFSYKTRAAWEAGFAKTIALDPVTVPPILGAVAFGLWRRYPGAIYLRGDDASGKTSITRQVIDLMDVPDPSEKIASFRWSTDKVLMTLMKRDGLVIDDFYADGPAGERKAQARLGEIVRAAYNQTVVSGDKVPIASSSFLLINGDLHVRGAAAQRMLALEVTRATRTDYAVSFRFEAHEARRVIGRRYIDWLADRDSTALSDEYADSWPQFASPQLAASAFGITLLNRFLAEHDGPQIELDAGLFGLVVDDGEGFPPLLRSLIEVVVGAVCITGSCQLMGSERESSAPILGRIDGKRVSLVPDQVMVLLEAARVEGTKASLAKTLEECGVLNRDHAASARTVTRRLEGKVTRLWETEGLFADDDLAKLREGFSGASPLS